MQWLREVVKWRCWHGWCGCVTVDSNSQHDFLKWSGGSSGGDYDTETDTSREPGSDTDKNYDDDNNGVLTDPEVQDGPVDEVAGTPSNGGGGDGRPSDELQVPVSPSSSGQSPSAVDSVPSPKTAPVSDNGGDAGGGASSSTRPRKQGDGRRPVTKCHSVPVAISGDTVIRLGQICYQVLRNGDGSWHERPRPFLRFSNTLLVDFHRENHVRANYSSSGGRRGPDVEVDGGDAWPNHCTSAHPSSSSAIWGRIEREREEIRRRVVFLLST